MPIAGVTTAELQMLQVVSNQLAMSTVDALQQGFSGTGSTAREIVIANEKAAEMKGIFFTMLTDLWRLPEIQEC